MGAYPCSHREKQIMRRGIRTTVDISFHQAVEAFRIDYAKRTGIILTYPQATRILCGRLDNLMPLRQRR